MSNNLFISTWINGAFSDLWTLHLTMTGCLVSVFTLLYSFLISKKGELKIYTEQLNHGDKSPTNIQKQRFAVRYIKKMSKAINLCLILLIGCVCLAIGSWVGLRLLSDNSQFFLLCIVGLLTILVLISMFYLCVKVYSQYRKDARL
ncbi:hypothetical protein SAMN04487902_11177 [Prevotella sp. ne3005]|nr:hypothetical protein SAMN04487902_11177 [Prevotella sp. ne3005]